MGSDRRDLDERPDLTPYAAEVRFLIGKDVDFPQFTEVSLLTNAAQIVRLKDSGLRGVGNEFGFRSLTAQLLGFETASEAEAAGLKLTLGVLWFGIVKRIPLSLDYRSALPVMVRDRTRGPGLTARGFAKLTRHTTTDQAAVLISKGFLTDAKVSQSLLLSMELYAASKLELTTRARFITLVSALEPLVHKELLGPNAVSLVDRLRSELDTAAKELGVDDSELASLRSRVGQLKRETIREALRRLSQEHLGDLPNAEAVLVDAYTLRSRILHEGFREANLDRWLNQADDTIRQLYSRILGLPLEA